MKNLVLAALVAFPSMARAHLMPEGQGSTRIIGNRAYTLLSVPASALTAYDDNRDGLLGRNELGRHGFVIEAMLEKRVRLYLDTVPGRTVWQTLSIEHAQDTPGSPMTAVTLVRISEWDKAPSRIRVVTDLFQGTNAAARVEFRAVLGERTEVDTLTAADYDALFFAPKSTPLTPGDVALAITAIACAVAVVALARRRHGYHIQPSRIL